MNIQSLSMHRGAIPGLLGARDDAWALNRFYKGGPLHVEHHGAVWIICNDVGINVAATPHGAVAFVDEAQARAVTERLAGR